MSHNHSHRQHSSKNLKIAFFLNLGFTVFEFIGGLYVNSIAIVSDAVHDLGDSLSLGTSWYLDQKSKKGANNKFSYGYKRFSLLGALINSIVLLIGSTYVIYEAVKRLIEPEHSDAQGMILFAIVGVAVNGYGAWKVSKGTSMNERVVSLHLLEDVLGWVAVLIVSIVLYFYDNNYLDPALSLLITLYILFNVFKRLKETLFVFLQGVPKDIDLDAIKNSVLQLDNVASLHHTHLWSQEGENHVFTTHIKLKNITEFDQILTVKKEVKYILQEYKFHHYTIETELDAETCELNDDN
ncbi:cation diffusion facilitator family transporter [Flavobacterium sp. ASW18X]|uniref:cation diffusion facilitator family transporter n=1 Tax=Flavobacterium sp. ASW18X TaxID=2572595 RepID=UPI0010AE8AB7|nr:cation diffusion facilitator family transporter [Flavobacterium sp. ASW18X]TKD65164.1 cation transporter [Flavobacterium sp. ASW18X]